MTAQDTIKTYSNEMTAIRRDFHAHPELGLEEHRTAGITAIKRATEQAYWLPLQTSLTTYSYTKGSELPRLPRCIATLLSDKMELNKGR